MTNVGLAFRATKDLDIVLYIKALDVAFVQAFWKFVRMGGYEVQEKSTGEKQFYRFQKPTNADYPFMLELFSRWLDVLQVADGGHLTPLPTEENVSSLSAILLMTTITASSLPVDRKLTDFRWWVLRNSLL